MPRTLESIVESHRAARARIAAGKPSWDRSIAVRPIINEDPKNRSEEHAATVANRIAKLLRSSLPAETFDVTNADYDTDLDEIVEDLQTLTPTSFADDPRYSTLEALNGRLDDLYDWADRNRVWLG